MSQFVSVPSIIQGVFAFAVALVVVSAEACTCLPLRPLEEEVAQSTVVFTGVIETVDTLVFHSSIGDQEFKRAVMRPDRVWKGVVGPSIEVLTAFDGAACGVDFGEGEEWLVFARVDTVVYNSELVWPLLPYAISCSRTGRAAGNPTIPLLGPTPVRSASWGRVKALYR